MKTFDTIKKPLVTEKGTIAQQASNQYFFEVDPRATKFDVRTGKSVGNAKLAFISVKVGDATTFPVKVEGNDIFVELD